MKFITLTFSLLIVLLPFITRGQEGQSASLDTKVSIHIEDGQLLDLLNQISAQTNIYFSYDPVLVNTDQRISMVVEEQSVQHVLDEVFGQKFHFNLLKNQLVITRQKGPGISAGANQQIRYELSGKLLNRQTEEEVPYASISVLGHPFGTISNVDGDFRLKIPAEYESDTLVVSSMGFDRLYILPDTVQHNELLVYLDPVEIQLKEVLVSAANPMEVLDKMIDNINVNYATNTQLMTSFYREVLKQDKEYINVSEAVMDILKAPYDNPFRQDQIRYLKGRKSTEVQSAFQLVDFKMQGGPYYITKLDVIKTMDSFIDKEFREYYNYSVERVIDYATRPTYIIYFEPDGKFDYLTYEGELYIDKETFALVHAEFSLSRSGKKSARRSLIRKKPRGFNVRPIDLDYTVTYKKHHNKWYLNSAQTSVKFHVKSRQDKINSVFHSISDLLITNHRETNLRRFKRDENFDSSDIFSEMITSYDEDFWGDYNVIKPSEDLRNAFKKDPKQGSFLNNASPIVPLTSQKSQP